MVEPGGGRGVSCQGDGVVARRDHSRLLEFRRGQVALCEASAGVEEIIAVRQSGLPIRLGYEWPSS
jgi:hypothetical protein